MKYQTYRLNWQGIEIEARYLSNHLDVIAHLEIKSINPHRASLPITDTGYLSHFHQIGSIERDHDGDVVACVLHWLDTRAQGPSWKRYVEESRQGELF
ncbi:MAG: hypothetical protein JKY46_04510 [Robiginitomaculum sp.]|nr:hypothetical protein [Robiginitomaculum sp.]